MENAAKALQIAGSVLMALILIGFLVFTYNSISSQRSTEEQAAAIKSATEINKKLEVYYEKGTLYGSEVISAINLMYDYDIQQVEVHSYTPIESNIKIKEDTDLKNRFKDMAGVDLRYKNYYAPGTYTKEKLRRMFNEVGNEIETVNNKYIDTLKVTLSYIDSMDNRSDEKYKKFRNPDDPDELVNERDYWYISNGINNTKRAEIEKYIDIWKTLYDLQTDFSRLKFKCENKEEDEYNGRISRMDFNEI